MHSLQAGRYPGNFHQAEAYSQGIGTGGYEKRIFILGMKNEKFRINQAHQGDGLHRPALEIEQRYLQ